MAVVWRRSATIWCETLELLFTARRTDSGSLRAKIVASNHFARVRRFLGGASEGPEATFCSSPCGTSETTRVICSQCGARAAIVPL